jgi:hypothetical protein
MRRVPPAFSASVGVTAKIVARTRNVAPSDSFARIDILPFGSPLSPSWGRKARGGLNRLFRLR